MTRILVLEGSFDMFESEGGFAPAGMFIGDNAVDIEIAKVTGAYGGVGRSCCIRDNFEKLKKVKLTFEILEA